MWSNKYIGIPYKDYGRDETGIDCWGLACLVYKQEFNIELPTFINEYKAHDRKQLHQIIAQHRESWVRLDQPKPGCLVLFRILGSESHVGIAVSETEFLHARNGYDSSVESFNSTNWKDRIVGYFEYSAVSGLVPVTAIPHPLQTKRVMLGVEYGSTIQQTLDRVDVLAEISPELKKRVVVLLNSRVVPASEYSTTVVKQGDTLEYRALPGEDIGRLVLTLAVIYVAFTFGAQVGALLTPAGTSAATAAFVGQTAITLVGTALVNAIMPIRPPTGPGDPGTGESPKLLSGAGNRINRYGTIPFVLGKMRVTPPLGAQNYMRYGSETQTEDGVIDNATKAYLDMLLVWGYGPVLLDEATLKIGEISLWDYTVTPRKANYTGLDYVTLDRRPGETQNTRDRFNQIYGTDREQKVVGVELTCDGLPPAKPRSSFRGSELPWTPTSTPGPWIEAGFSSPSEKISVALHFPQGLRAINVRDGTNHPAPVRIRLEYKTPTSDWQPWTTQTIGGKVTAQTTTRTEQEYYNDESGSGYYDVVVTTYAGTITDGTARKDGFTWVVSMSRARRVLADRWAPGDTIVVRARRETGDETEPNSDWRYTHTVVFSDATSSLNQRPAVDPKDTVIAKTALTIQATDQLNNQIEGINAVVQTWCLNWTGSTWTPQATSNPASLFRYVLQSAANPQRVLDSEVSSKIDLVKLQYWHEYCNQLRTDPETGTTYRYEFNAVVGQQRSVLEILRDICAAGKASPSLQDGRWTVIIDEPKPNVIQHFSPHNSWGFEATKSLPRLPDALKVNFFDESQGYQEAELIIPFAGKTFAECSLFESISLPGVTNKYLAKDHARWHIAQAQLRPEVYTLNTDVEYLVCNRGDRVKVSHDVPMWGLGSGRISNRVTDSIFDLDESVPVDNAGSYTMRVRGKTGISTVRNLKTSFTITAVSRISNIVTLTFGQRHPLIVGSVVSVTIPGTPTLNNQFATITEVSNLTAKYRLTGTNVTQITTTGTVILQDGYYSRIQFLESTTQAQVDASDLFLYGENQNESQDLIVISIEPLANKAAKITLADYGVTNSYNIFTDYLTLSSSEVFESQITLPPQLLLNSFGTKKPTITGFASDETVMELIAPGVFRYKIKVSYTNDSNLPDTTQSIEAQVDYADSEDSIGLISILAPFNSGTIEITDVEELQKYKVRLRYVGRDGRTGEWTAFQEHTVIGKTSHPAAVTEASAEVIASSGSVAVKWAKNLEIDLAGYEVRTSNSNWGSSDFVFRGSANSFTFAFDSELTAATLYIRAYDTGNRYSLTSATLAVTLPLPNAVASSTAVFAATSTTDSSVTFTWPAAVPTAFAVKHYALRLNKPDGTTISEDIAGTTWTTQADWLGVASFVITTVDIKNRSSATSRTLNVTKLRPAAPTSATFKAVDGFLEIDWNDSIKTTLPVAGYEVRKNNLNTSWGVKDANFIWRGNTSKTGVSGLVAGVNTFFINAYDTDNRYANNGNTFTYTVIAPLASTGVTYEYASALTGNTITLNWTGVKGTFDIEKYEVVLTKPTGYTSVSAVISANTWTTQADWIGNASVSITAIDKAGVRGATASTIISKAKPDKPVVFVPVIKGSGLLFNWADVPRSSGGMPVAGYELRSENDDWGFAGAVWRGKVSECEVAYLVPGLNTWYLTTFDTDGKYSDPLTITFTQAAASVPRTLTTKYADSSSTAATINISWLAPATINFDIDYYELVLTKPGPIVETYNTKATLLTLAVDWVGSMGITVRAVDVRGNKSQALTGTVSKSPPIVPSSYIALINKSGTLDISWPKAVSGSLPIQGYEIRTRGTLPGTDDFIWRGSANSASISTLQAGTNEWSLWVYDTDTAYSTNSLNIEFSLALPNKPTDLEHTFSTSLTNASCLFKWSHPSVSALPIKEYDVQLQYSSPRNTTITSTRNTTDWSVEANWVGTATLTVVAVDVLGNKSVPESINIVKVLPNTPSIPTISVKASNLVLSWTDSGKTTLPLAGYELYDSSNILLWKGQATSTEVSLVDLVSNDSVFPLNLSFYLANYDTDSQYSAQRAQATYTVTRPTGVVINQPVFSDTSLTNATVTLSWNDVQPIFGLYGYRIQTDATDIVVNSTTVTLPANWIGNRNFTVKVVDNLGVESAPASITVEKLAPRPVENYRAQVIDNTILLYWTLPARTTLPISHVNIRKGNTWETAEQVGDKDGTFTSFSELRGGKYTYWIATVDTENIYSEPVSLSAQVSQPPDFVFNAEYIADFSTGTRVNAKQEENANTLILPINLTETFEQHFATRTWTNPQAQVSAGYPVYIQPGMSSGYYEQVYDYGTVLGSSQVTLNLSGANIVGTNTVSTVLSLSLDGITYIDYSQTSSVFGTSFRFVKVRVTVTQQSIGAIYRISSLIIRLDAKQKSDSGKIDVLFNDAGGTVVNFVNDFIDVTSVTLTPNAVTPLIPVYDFKDTTVFGTYSVNSNVVTINSTNHGLKVGQLVKVFFTTGTAPSGRYIVTQVPNANSYSFALTTANTSGNVSVYPNSMTVYLFNTSGVRQSGTVTWNIRGY
jgi:sulfur carrier protein ThiS